MDILKGFNGILQVDGYEGYKALAEPRRVGGTPLTLAYCSAHARRKMQDICQKDGSEIAAEGLRRIARIYKMEAKIRGHAPEERLAVRQAQSAPPIADLPPLVDPSAHPHWDGHQPGRKHHPPHLPRPQERPLRRLSGFWQFQNPAGQRDMTRAAALRRAWHC